MFYIVSCNNKALPLIPVWLTAVKSTRSRTWKHRSKIYGKPGFPLVFWLGNLDAQDLRQFSPLRPLCLWPKPQLMLGVCHTKKKTLVPYETTHSPCHRLYDNRAIWQTAAISSSSLYRNRPWRHQIQEAITRLAANYWLECSRVWPSTLICLHIKLHTFLGRRNCPAS